MKNIYFYLICAFVKIADAVVPDPSPLHSKIIGGAPTDISYKRYMTSLRIKVKHFCCGFIISRRIVMSAGSCAYHMKLHSGPDYIYATVFAGNFNTSNTYLGKVVQVDHAMHHQYYDPEDPIGTSGYDIGYILLARQLPKLAILSIITLSSKNVQYDVKYAIYGWGSGEFEDPKNELCDVIMSPYLKKIEIKMTYQEVCEKLLERHLKPNQKCGIGIREGETAAQGDAGSPLIRGYRFYGITTIVNIVGSRSPIVFIEAKPFEEYMNDLKTAFPEEKKSKFPDTNAKQRQPSGVPNNKKVRTDRSEELGRIFTYGKNANGGKYAKCLQCTKEMGFEKIIKMKNGNTSGIKNHLKCYHLEVFGEIYGEAVLPTTQISCEQSEKDES